MRYYTERPELYSCKYGIVYRCNHPVYNSCTLYLENGKGLAVIQQRKINKYTFWTEIDPWLNDELYLNSGFEKYFNKRSGTCKDGLYPTVTVRQMMWALRMKPLPKERWETVFDRKDI